MRCGSGERRTCPSPRAHYLVAGTGPDAAAIEAAAAANHVALRVHLLGQVTTEEREELLRGSDLFIQANVPVPGDMEGFGLVTVEAAVRGTPVLASGIEGIRDAVIDGGTGTLVPAADVDRWIEAVEVALADPAVLAEQGRRARQSHRPSTAKQRWGGHCSPVSRACGAEARHADVPGRADLFDSGISRRAAGRAGAACRGRRARRPRCGRGSRR